MLKRKSLSRLLLFGGWAVLWATAPWPFFFVHWLALGVTFLGALSLWLNITISIHKNALLLLGIPLVLLAWMWLNNYIRCKEPFLLPGPYVFWLAIPLMVYSLQDTYGTKLLSLAWNVLTLATLTVGMYGVIAILLQGFRPGYLPEHSWTFRFREEFACHTGLHPPYFGMFAAAAIVHLSKGGRKDEALRRRFLIGWGLLVLAALVVLLETRIHVLMLALGFLYFKPLQQRYMIPLALVLLILLLFKGENRFQELFSVRENSATLRLESWRCGFRLFNEAPLIGHSACRLQARLNACYDAGNFHLQGMNTHNQFIHFAAAGGLPALILWILWWIILVRFLKGNHVSTAGFQVLLFLGFCLTENVLERQWGGLLAGLVLAAVLQSSSERSQI